MKHTNYVIAISFMLLLCSCVKEPVIVKMQKAQTQCSDAWGYGETSPQTVNLLKTYLTSKDISVNNVTLVKTAPDGTLFCQACTCPNGNTFYVEVESKYQDSLEALGFKK